MSKSFNNIIIGGSGLSNLILNAIMYFPVIATQVVESNLQDN